MTVTHRPGLDPAQLQGGNIEAVGSAGFMAMSGERNLRQLVKSWISSI